MEIILKSNNENSIAKIVALAKKLNVSVEQPSRPVDNKEDLKDRILNFKSRDISSFGDGVEWQRNERNDPNLPFSK